MVLSKQLKLESCGSPIGEYFLDIFTTNHPPSNIFNSTLYFRYSGFPAHYVHSSQYDMPIWAVFVTVQSILLHLLHLVIIGSHYFDLSLLQFLKPWSNLLQLLLCKNTPVIISQALYFIVWPDRVWSKT